MLSKVDPKISGPLSCFMCGFGSVLIFLSLNSPAGLKKYILTGLGILITLIGAFIVGVTIGVNNKRTKETKKEKE